MQNVDNVDNNEDKIQEKKKDDKFSIKEWTNALGALIIVFGILAGFVLGNKMGYYSMNWGIVLGVSCSSIILGSLFLALGKIIELLEEIARNNKL